jgi:hypothetical protein
MIIFFKKKGMLINMTTLLGIIQKLFFFFQKIKLDQLFF